MGALHMLALYIYITFAFFCQQYYKVNYNLKKETSRHIKLLDLP